MAVTINSQPASDSLNSPYRPLEIRATSNNTSSDGTPTVYTVKMKCYINIDGVDDNTDRPLVLDPDIGTSYTFTFDISKYVAGEETLTSTIQNRLNAVGLYNADANSIKAVKVRFKEVTLDTTTGVLTDQAYSSYSNTFYAINGAWQHDEVADKFDNYVLDTGYEALFLTNYRGARELKVDDSYYLSLYTIRTTNPFLKLIKYSGRNLTGTTIQVRYKELTLNGKRPDLAIGARNINASSGWIDGAGNPASVPVIDDTVGSYSVQLLGNGYLATPTSEKITFNLDHTPCAESHTKIKFLNRLGAFEYFTFRGYRDRSTEVRKNYYNRALGADHSVNEGGDRVLFSDTRTEFVAHSQALTEAERIYLEELLDGHECFVEEGNNYIPIKVRAGKTKIIEEGTGLFHMKITYQYANPTRRQYGGY